MNILAIVFVVLVVYSLNLPYTPAGLPWNDDFDVSVVNYTPLAIVLPLIFGIWYLVSAKDRYQGPVRTLEEDEVTAGAVTIATGTRARLPPPATRSAANRDLASALRAPSGSRGVDSRVLASRGPDLAERLQIDSAHQALDALSRARARRSWGQRSSTSSLLRLRPNNRIGSSPCRCLWEHLMVAFLRRRVHT